MNNSLNQIVVSVDERCAMLAEQAYADCHELQLARGRRLTRLLRVTVSNIANRIISLRTSQSAGSASPQVAK